MGSSPSRGIQPIFSEEYVEREKEKKDAHILICTFPFIVTFVFLLRESIVTDILSDYSLTSYPVFKMFYEVTYIFYVYATDRQMYTF